MTLRLLLVRHGLSTFNTEGRIQGRNDLSTLTDEGRAQAVKAGKTLASLTINAIYSSPLKRAAETTQILIEQSPHKVNPIYTNDLLEIDLGSWSGLTKEEVKERFPEAVATWRQKPRDLTIKRKDGSSFKPVEELLKQANIFLEKLFNNHISDSDQTILIVAHNAILRCILLKLLGEPEQGFRRLQIDNTSISIVNITGKTSENKSIQIECLNSISHLNPPLPSAGLRKKRILLVRHGETNWNKEARFQGQIDIPLNENGKKQATAAGIFLQQVQIDQAFSSEMSRPKETAEIILKFHPKVQIELKKELIEISHGLWEGKLEEEIKSKWPDLLNQWQESPNSVQMPQGENIHEVWARSVKCWQNISDNITVGSTALIVAHDAVNKTILCHLLGLTPAEIWMIKQGNGAITAVDISEDPEIPNIVTCLNLTSHLGGVLDNTASGAL